MHRTVRVAAVVLTVLVGAVLAPAGASAAGLRVAVTAKPAQFDNSRSETVRYTVRQGRAIARGATVTCTLDRVALSRCASPLTLRGLKPGKHTLVIAARSRVGRRTLTGSTTIAWTLDVIRPGRPQLATADGDWNRGPVTVRASRAADASGIDRYVSQLSTDDGSTWSNPAPGFTRVIDAEGITNVRFRAIDEAGNAGPFAMTTVRVDNSAPTIPVIAGGSAAWQPAAAGVVFAAGSTDAGVGAITYEYRTQAGTGAFSGAVASPAAVITAEGATFVQFRAVDGLGNASDWSATSDASTVRLDRTNPTAPSVSGGSSAWLAQGLSSVTGAGSTDALSGVSYQHRTSTNGGIAWSGATAGATASITAEGETLVQVRALDGAGNASDWAPGAATAASTVRLDRSAPTAPDVSGVSEAWQSVGSVTVAGSGSSDSVSPFSYQHRINGGAPIDGAATILDEGERFVQVRSVDSAGNASAWMPTVNGAGNTVRIDRTLPAVPAITAPVGPIAGTHDIVGTSSDTGSGVASVVVTFQGATNGTACTLTTNLAAWTCPWATAGLSGEYQVTATATDFARNTRSDTRTITVKPAAFVIAETSGATAVTEGDAIDTYTVRLATQPTASVVVTVSTGTGTQITALPAALTFTPANWSTAQTVTVTAIDDQIAETSPMNAVIAHTAASTDVSYHEMSTNVTATVHDDDQAGLEFVGALEVEEGTGSDTYTVSLTSEPTAMVTVDLTGTQVDATPNQLSFDAEDWDQPKTVTVTALDDSIDESEPHAGSVTHVVTSADSFYGALVAASHPVSVRDNDTAGYTVADDIGSRVEGTSGTYTLRLTSQPVGTVVVTPSTDNDFSVTPSSLTFNGTNWDVPQTFTFTATDDSIDEADTAVRSITFGIGGTATGFPPLAASSITIEDNDQAAVQVSAPSATATEGGPGASYTIRLATQPTANVTVDLNHGTDVAATPSSLTFTNSTWATAQTVTVEAVNDDVDEDTEIASIAHSVVSTDAIYGGRAVIDVAVTVIDNDDAGYMLVQSGGSTAVAEAGPTSDNYTIALQSQPLPGATISVTPVVDTSQLKLVTAPLVFTEADWSVPQTVTVRAVDDSIAEQSPSASTVSHLVSVTGDDKYSSMPLGPITVSVTDNDTVGIVLSPAGDTTVAEGNPDVITYTVALRSQPAANVSASIGNANPSQLSAAPSTLTFTTENWSTPQLVTVAAVNDLAVEGSQTYSLTHVAESADDSYDIVGPNRSVLVIDNDANYIVAAQSVSVTEAAGAGRTDTFDVQLSTQPLANVTIAVTNPDGQVVSAPATLTFTPANWAAPQTVTVTAVDDFVDEADSHDGRTTLTATSAGDSNYDTKVTNVDAEVLDDDVRGVTVSVTGASTSVSEAGDTDTIDVVLDSQPTQPVTITLSGTQVTTSPTALVFDATSGGANSWNTPRTVTVSAAADAVDEEDPHAGSIAYAITTTGDYGTVAPADTSVLVGDNDERGITVTPTDGNTAVDEAGLTFDSYSIHLNSEPTAPVTITPASTGVGVSAPITFDSTNWQDDRTVTVTALADSVDQGITYQALVTYAFTGALSDYAGFSAASTAVTVTDDDTAGVTISETTAAVSETGTTDSYTVVLDTQPTHPVAITLTDGDQLSATPATLTFGTATGVGGWNTAQTVTVAATDDQVDEGSHTGTITHAATSTDGVYGGIGIGSVLATISDNDTAALVVDDAGLAVSEPATSDTFTVKLATQPTASVTVTVAGSGEATAGPGTRTFTADNWNETQEFAVTATDDFDDDGSQAQLFTLTASGEAKYASVTGSATATVADDDVSALVISPSTAVTVDEAAAGTSATFSVKLATRPTATVTVTPAAGASGQVQTTSPALSFTTDTWDTAQDVTVTAVNDDVDEDPSHLGQIDLAVSSTDALYAALARSVDVNVLDNDTRSVTIVQSGGTTSVAEAGTTSDTYTVRLDSAPTQPVSIALASTGVGVAPTTLNFTGANWNQTQTVTVAAPTERVDQGISYDTTVTYTVTAPGSDYAAVTIPATTVNVTDDDTAGFTVTPTGESNLVRENGATDTYSIVLDSQPTSNVVLSVGKAAGAHSDRLVVSPATLTFTATDWDQPHVVTLSAVNDSLEQGITTTATTHAITAGDATYAALAAPAGVTVTVEDNDHAVLLSKSNLTVSETGATSDTYTVKLTTRPGNPVTVNVAHDAEVSVSPASVSFNAANFDTPQAITVTAVDDQVDDADQLVSAITHTSVSADVNYSGRAVGSVAASVADDDTAGYTVTSEPGDLTEGASGSYGFRLNSRPTAAVTITPTANADFTYAPASITIAPADWNATQTFTVTAFDDLIDEDTEAHSVAFTTTTTDPKYAAAPPSTDVSITDNDTRGITVALGDGLNVTEAGPGTDTYTVVLNTEPTADVSIALSSPQVTATTPLLFTSGNWATPQTVTVTPIADSIDEATTTYASSISYTVTSADTKYAGLSVPNSPVTITDDDTAGYIVSAAPTVLDEGEAGENYTIVLDSQPTADVTIAPASDADFTYAPTSITFTAETWSTPRSILITAFDDRLDEAAPETHTVIFASTSTDTNYAPDPSSISIDVTDNDTAGINVDPGTSVEVQEGGATDTYSIVLQSEPTSDVVIALDAPNDMELDRASLTFTPANWETAQVVTVTADDDVAVEGRETHTITHTVTTSDANYTLLTASSVTVTVFDNDGAVIITDGDNVGISEAGTPDTYSVRLSTAPSSDVTVTISTDTQVTALPTTLTFTPDNWNDNQVVAVTAVDDDVAEGTHAGSITHTSASTDSNYAFGLAIASVTPQITDNDSAGVVVTPTAVAVTEGGVTSSYAVRLNSQPTANVTVTGTNTAGQVTLGDALTFTPGDWATQQSISVTAVNDPDDEVSPLATTIANAASSSDPNYNVAAPSVEADVTDNDEPGLNILTDGQLTVAEGGAGDSYTVALTSRPSGTVTVTLGGTQAQVTRSTSTLTFDADTWATPQTVTLSATADFIAEGPHSASIVHAISGPGTYTGLADVPVSVDVVDNDVVGVTVSRAAVAVTESGITATYTVRLDSQPVDANVVTITPNGGTHVTVAPATRTFSSADWNTPKTFTVTAVDNGAVEDGFFTQVITHASTSTGGQYNGTAVASVTATIENNDPALLLGPTTGLTVTEGGTPTSYTVRLASEPTEAVSVTATAPGGDLTFGTVSFDGSDWHTPKSISITPIDDPASEDPTESVMVTSVATSADGNYNNRLAGPFAVDVVDNDTAGVVIGGGAVAVTEASGASHTDTFTVRLSTQPASNVTVAFGTSADSSLEATPALPLVFTSANWNTEQAVTVTATDDAIVEAALHTSPHAWSTSSAAPGYGGLSGAVAASVTDDDIPGITVASTPTTLVEGGSDTFTVVLDRQPEDDVTVTFADDAESDVTVPVSKAVTFTPATWSVAQSVTVVATDDAVADADTTSTLTAAVTSTGRYDGYVISPITFAVTNDDTAGLTVNGAGDLDVTEGGTGDSFTVVLDSEPAADVTVTFTTAGADVLLTNAVHTFTAGNWDDVHTVNVAAVDDGFVEGNAEAGVEFDGMSASTDTNFGGMSFGPYGVDVTDDDSVQVVVENDGLAVTEDGGTDSFTVRLNSQPPSSVIVSFTGTGQATAAPDATFTTDNWRTAQTVTVSANDDAVVEASPHSETLTGTVTGAGEYAALPPVSLPVSITDNDTAPPSSLDIVDPDAAGLHMVRTGPLTDSIQVRLSRQPSGPVSVGLALGDGTSGVTITTGSTLSFNSTNWDTYQTVTTQATANDCGGGGGDGSPFLKLTASGSDFDGIEASVTGSLTGTPQGACV